MHFVLNLFNFFSKTKNNSLSWKKYSNQTKNKLFFKNVKVYKHEKLKAF